MSKLKKANTGRLDGLTFRAYSQNSYKEIDIYLPALRGKRSLPVSNMIPLRVILKEIKD